MQMLDGCLHNWMTRLGTSRDSEPIAHFAPSYFYSFWVWHWLKLIVSAIVSASHIKTCLDFMMPSSVSSPRILLNCVVTVDHGNYNFEVATLHIVPFQFLESGSSICNFHTQRQVEQLGFKLTWNVCTLKKYVKSSRRNHAQGAVVKGTCWMNQEGNTCGRHSQTLNGCPLSIHWGKGIKLSPAFHWLLPEVMWQQQLVNPMQ